MTTLEHLGFSLATEKNLHVALDDVADELCRKIELKLDTLLGVEKSLTRDSPSRHAVLEALCADLPNLVIESVAKRLLESRDENAHARRNALMRVLVEADAPSTLTDAIRANSLVVYPDDEELLTSEQAAKLLNVSRPHMNKLLDNGAIPGVERLEGGHRRISKGAVLKYKAEMKVRQACAAEQVTRLSEEMGLYELPVQKRC